MMKPRYKAVPASAGRGLVYGILDTQHEWLGCKTMVADRLHERDYTQDEALQVADWLNGDDQPLIG